MAEKLYKPLLIDSIKATVDIPKHRFVSYDGNLCAAGAKAYGVSEVDTEAEQYVPVSVMGILLVEAGGTIAAWARVSSDTSGKAVTTANSAETNARSLDAGEAGDIIRIVRGI